MSKPCKGGLTVNVLPASSQQNTRNWTLGRACQELLTAKSDGPKHFILLHLKHVFRIDFQRQEVHSRNEEMMLWCTGNCCLVAYPDHQSLSLLSWLVGRRHKKLMMGVCMCTCVCVRACVHECVCVCVPLDFFTYKCGTNTARIEGNCTQRTRGEREAYVCLFTVEQDVNLCWCVCDTAVCVQSGLVSHPLRYRRAVDPGGSKHNLPVLMLYSFRSLLWCFLNPIIPSPGYQLRTYFQGSLKGSLMVTWNVTFRVL